MLVGSVSPFKQTGNTRGPRVRGNRVSFARDNVSLSKPCRWNKPFRNRGRRGESIPKSIETTTKLSLIFLEIVGFAARKGGGKRAGIFLDFFFVDFDGRIENSFGNCLLNAVSMQVPVNFYKLKFRPWNFIDSKRLSRRPSLDLV